MGLVFSSSLFKVLTLVTSQLPLLTLLGEVLSETQVLQHHLCPGVTLRSCPLWGTFSLRRRGRPAGGHWRFRDPSGSKSPQERLLSLFDRDFPGIGHPQIQCEYRVWSKAASESLRDEPWLATGQMARQTSDDPASPKCVYGSSPPYMSAWNRQTVDLKILLKLAISCWRGQALKVLQAERKGCKDWKDHSPSGQSDSFLPELTEVLNASQASIQLDAIRRDLLWIFF